MSIRVNDVPNAPVNYDLTGIKIMVHDLNAPYNASTSLIDVSTLVSAYNGVEDGDKGDINVTTGGTIWTINNHVVSPSKITQVAGQTLFGNPTGSAGDLREITLGTGLSFNGNALNVEDNNSIQKINIFQESSLIGSRSNLNFSEGPGIKLTVEDDSLNDEIKITIEADPTAPVIIDDGDYGDITVSNDGLTWTIDNNVINTVNIVDEAVTLEKLENIPAESILGNPTNTLDTGSYITLGSTLEFDSTSIQVVDNTSIQKIEISKAGTLIGTRKGINFDFTGLTAVFTDDSINDRVNISIVTPVTRFGVYYNDSFIAAERAVNFIEGDNISIEIVDDIPNERVNITINASADGIGEFLWQLEGGTGPDIYFTAGNVGVGTATPSSLLHLGVSSTTTGTVPSDAKSLMLQNTFAPTTSLTAAQLSPSLAFKSKQLDIFQNTLYDVGFKVYSSASNFGSTLLQGVRQETILNFGSSDSGSLIVPMKLTSGGNTIFANGISVINTFGRRTIYAGGGTGGYLELRGSPNNGDALYLNSDGGNLGTSGSIVKIEARAITNPTGSRALTVIGDAGLNVLTCFNSTNVSIGPANTASVLAQLDVNSVGRGVLFPSMTTLQRNGIEKGLVSVSVVSGGSGFAIPPTITVNPSTNGGGLPARVTAVLGTGINADKVVSVTVNFRGSNYSDISEVTFSYNYTGSGGPGNPDGSGVSLAALSVNSLTIPHGLMIYNTDTNEFQYYNGTVWKTIQTV